MNARIGSSANGAALGRANLCLNWDVTRAICGGGHPPFLARASCEEKN